MQTYSPHSRSSPSHSLCAAAKTTSTMKNLSMCLVFIVVLQTSWSASISRQRRSLYSFEDSVEQLTANNFKEKILNSSHAYLVEFYVSWCGDCQRFAPSWKEFGKEVASWSDLVRVGVFDCSDEDNTAICREYEIVKYPTVRYFHEFYSKGVNRIGDNLFTLYEDEETVSAHKISLINAIVKEQENGRGSMYPNLLPYKQNNVSHIFDSSPITVKFGFLVVLTKPNDTIGAEIALDLHKTPDVTVRYSYRNDQKSGLYVIDHDHDKKTKITLLEGSDLKKEEIKAAITAFLQEKGVKVIEDKKFVGSDNHPDGMLPDSSKAKGLTQLRERVKKMKDVVFQMDLETALRYSLKQEVSTTKVIEGEKLEALKAFVRILKKYLPLGLDGDDFYVQLLDLASNSTQLEGVKVEELVRQVEKNATLRVFSSPQRYLGCEGSTSKYRRYPCSLWKLFHYLTVNSVLKNISHRRAYPLEVLDAVHGYVKHFFGCKECSLHFQEMAKKRKIHEVESLEASILWLWKAHNEVNERLYGDATQDPEYPKYQFPTKVRCAECWNEDGSWNEKEVVKYIKFMYNEVNVRYVGADTRVLFPGLE